MISKPVSALAIGDVIIDGKHATRVQKLIICPSTRKGIRRYHVDDTHCYDSLRPVWVIPKKEVPSDG